MTPLPHLDLVREKLARARHVLFITGAGVSADSGLPTYRGIGGLYNDQQTEEGMPIETALSAETLRKHPSITWKYLARIEASCRAAAPNPAHRAIAALQEQTRVTVLTQNIDGFHTRAGSRGVIEIHGNLFDLFCPHCGYQITVPDYAELGALPPVCPDCTHFLRPGVVLFNEMLPEKALSSLQNVIESGYEMVFSIGTTSVFPYISQPFVLGKMRGAMAIEINPSTTEVSRIATIKWACGAADALTQLCV